MAFFKDMRRSHMQRVPVALMLLLSAEICLAQNPSGDDEALRSAAQAYAARDLPRAESELQTLLKGSPDNYHALDLLGMLRAQQQRNADAEELFQRAIRAKADFAGAHIHLGMLYVQMDDPETGIPQLQEGLRLAPDRRDAIQALVAAFRTQGRTAVSAGNLEKALAALTSARKLAPEDADVSYEYGMVALRMALLPDAISTFQQSLKVRDDNALALYGLGRAYLDSAKFEDARQQFARYVQLQPEDASGHYALGMALTSLQRSDEARHEFEKSIALKPAQTESYFRLGVLQLDARDRDAAESNFRRVLERDPNHAGALAALGRLELERKHYSEAANLLEKAIASNDSLREGHYYLGLTYARMGRSAESEKQLQIAERLEHEELERQRTVFKVLDSTSNDPSPAKR
jgi:tetratricopeptide (TPR) repeat protein